MIETPEVFRISRYLGKEKHISYDERLVALGRRDSIGAFLV
jgi:hypothetical protein